jgi:ABC-2 type transport system ATP-binding protein
VPDNPDLFLKLKGIEYLNFLSNIYKVPKDKSVERIELLSKKFNIYDNLNEKIQNYSHGMRQKIVLIGALLHTPHNWILDEPMTGLDPKASYTLKKLMREHASQGNTVFFSTHVLEVAEKLCDKIAVIDKGKIIFVGTCDEIKEKSKSNSSLEESFLKIIEG